MTEQERKRIQELLRLHQQDSTAEINPVEVSEPKSTLTNPGNHPGMEGEYQARLLRQKLKLVADLLRDKSDHPL